MTENIKLWESIQNEKLFACFFSGVFISDLLLILFLIISYLFHLYSI